MDQLPSSKSLQVQLTGLLKSSHSLLGVLAVITLCAFWLCLKFTFPFGSYALCATLIVLVLLIVCRFALRGPEADRAQPSVSLTHQDNRVQAQFLNFDMNAQLIAVFQSVLTRRPLPAPSATIEGLASDPDAFRPITAEMAQTLAQEDAQLLLPPPVNTPPTPEPGVSPPTK
jgi:hypothetical protein